MAHGLGGYDGFFTDFFLSIFNEICLVSIKKEIRENPSNPSNQCAIKSEKNQRKSVESVKSVCHFKT